MKNLVAFFLVLTIFFTMVPGAWMGFIVEDPQLHTVDELKIWREVLLVILGALSTYLGTKS